MAFMNGMRPICLYRCQQQRNHNKQNCFLFYFFEFLLEKREEEKKILQNDKLADSLKLMRWMQLIISHRARSIHDMKSKKKRYSINSVAVVLNIALYKKHVPVGRYLMNFYATFGMQNNFIQIVLPRCASNENSIHWCYSTRPLKHVLKFIANWIASEAKIHLK